MKNGGYGYDSVRPSETASNHRTKLRQITERNRTSGLVEIKLGGAALIEEGAATLNVLSGLVDTSRQEPVAFKMVVTATGDCAYRRTDGIVVCPISALRP